MEQLINSLNNYRKKYDISIQFWDEINIFVHAKDFYHTELLSMGGYAYLDDALEDLLNCLDRWNTKK